MCQIFWAKHLLQFGAVIQLFGELLCHHPQLIHSRIKTSRNLTQIFWLLNSVPSYISLFCQLFSYSFLPHGATAPTETQSTHYRGFTITLRHTSVCRTPLDGCSALRKYFYLTTHSTHNNHPCAGEISYFHFGIFITEKNANKCKIFFLTFGSMTSTLFHRFTEDFCTMIISE